MSGWEDEIERVAAYLYREDTGWTEGPMPWRALPEVLREPYRKRASAVAAMLSFPYHARVVSELARLCLCDHNPEKAQGEWKALIHGEQPYATIRIDTILHAAEAYVMAWLRGNPDTREELAALIEAARTDR